MKQNYKSKSNKICETCIHSNTDLSGTHCLEDGTKMPMTPMFIGAEGLDIQTQEYNAQIMYRNKWMESHSVSPTGICDQWTKYS